MLMKACFLIQPLEQGGGCQKCCISLCSKVFINHFYQMKASPECLNILIYWSKCRVDRLRRILRRKVWTGIFYEQIYRLFHYLLHQVAHIDYSAPRGKQHEPLTGICGIGNWWIGPVMWKMFPCHYPIILKDKKIQMLGNRFGVIHFKTRLQP